MNIQNSSLFWRVCNGSFLLLLALQIILSISYYSLYGSTAKINPIGTIFFTLSILLVNTTLWRQDNKKTKPNILIFFGFIFIGLFIFYVYIMFSVYLYAIISKY